MTKASEQAAKQQAKQRPVAAGENTTTKTGITEMSNDLQYDEVDAPEIDNQFKSLVRELSPEERQKLEDSLLAEGCRDHLAVWKGKNILLDGYNRLEICEKHDIDYYIVEIELPDRDHAILWILENQLGRRNLSKGQQAVMCAGVVKAISDIEKKERARKAGKAGGKHRPKDLSSEAETTPKLKDKSKTRTRAAVAKEHNVPENTIRDVIKIEKSAPDIFEEIKEGKTSVREANKKIKKQEAATQPQPGKKYPDSDLLSNLIDHIDGKINAMEQRYDTVAEMVASDRWDQTQTQDIVERLDRTINSLMQFQTRINNVLEGEEHDAMKKSA